VEEWRLVAGTRQSPVPRLLISPLWPWVLLLALLGLPWLWVWPQRGITASYYANPDWQGRPVVTRAERQINLETIAADPETFPPRQFSVEWVGWIRIDRDGVYTFATQSDDGSEVQIDDRQVVDNLGVHPLRRRAGSIALDRGFHQLRVRYMQAEGYAEWALSWTPPVQPESAVPPHHLFARRPAPAFAFLTRHVSTLWALSWLAAALWLAARIAVSEHEITSGHVKAFAQKAGLAAASSLFALAAVEGALRLAGYLAEDRRDLEARLRSAAASQTSARRALTLGNIVQPSRFPGIVYELKPDTRGTFAGQPLTVNSRGLRDFEYPVRKPEGTIRIVGLGDSSLFGWGVRIEDTTLKVLERRLNATARAPRFEVLNFAVPGYNTAMEAEVFVRKCLDYSPDVVLLNFNTNDYDVPFFMKNPEDAATLRRLYVFDLAYSAYERFVGVAARELQPFDFSNRSLTLEQSARLDEDPLLPEEYAYMVGAKGFARAIDLLVRAVQPRGIPLVVFDVRSYPGLHPTHVANQLRDSQRELLERLSREKGFHFLNTYPYYVEYLRRHPDAPFPRVFAVSDTDSHPNPLAHSINAEALYDYLTSHGLIARRGEP
jgi:hypothetical protein